MKHFLFLLFFGLCIHSYAQKPSSFIALGDSYTVGETVASNKNWPTQLSNQLNINSPEIIAVTGWRTDQLLEATLAFQPEGTFDLVSILIGVNNQYQNKPFASFETDLPQIFDQALRLSDNDTTAIFFVSIPDYFFTPFGQKHEKGAKISDEIDQYNAYTKAFAEKMNVPFVNITPISRKLDRKLVAKDGLHPSAYQYELWVTEIMKELNWDN